MTAPAQEHPVTLRRADRILAEQGLAEDDAQVRHELPDLCPAPDVADREDSRPAGSAFRIGLHGVGRTA